MDDRTLFERWRDEQSAYMPVAEREPPTTLVRVHVLTIPDAVPCSLDGCHWGVLRTIERPRKTRAGTVLVRSWHLDGADPGTPGEPVGAGFEPACVFVRRDVGALVGAS